MKHAFLPAPSLFYISLIASSHPYLSFCLEILENLKLTKDGTSKVWAQAAPGPSANGIQSLGCFAEIHTKNLSSSLSGSYFLPEKDKQPSSVPGRDVSPCFLSRACEAAAGRSIHSWKVSPAPSHQHLSTTAPPGQRVRLEEKHRATPSLTFHFQSLQWLLGPWLFSELFVQVIVSVVQPPPAVLQCLKNPQSTHWGLCACLALLAAPHFFTSIYK